MHLPHRLPHLTRPLARLLIIGCLALAAAPERYAVAGGPAAVAGGPAAEASKPATETDDHAATARSRLVALLADSHARLDRLNHRQATEGNRPVLDRRMPLPPRVDAGSTRGRRWQPPGPLSSPAAKPLRRPSRIHALPASAYSRSQELVARAWAKQKEGGERGDGVDRPKHLSGLFDNALFAQIAGADARELGSLYTAAIPGIQGVAGYFGSDWTSRMFGGATATSYQPSWTRSNDTYAATLRSADAAINQYSLQFLNGSRPGGNFNQFLGQWQSPNYLGWSSPGYAGVSTYDLGLSTLATMGFNASSPYSFGTQFTMNLNNYMYSPWSQPSFGWYGYAQANGYAQASGRAAGLSGSAGTQDIAERYRALGDLQIDGYFQDAALINLRAESNYFLLGYAYFDPWYMYFQFWMQDWLNWYYQQSPFYPDLVDAAVEMSSWTDDDVPPAELAYRNEFRRYYAWLVQVVDYEAAWRISNDPVFLSDLTLVVDFLNDQLDSGWSSEGADLWYADWSARWTDAYSTSAELSGLPDTIDDLMADFPAFQEYLAHNRSIAESLHGHEDTPLLQQTGHAMGRLAADTSANEALNQDYQSFLDTVGTAAEDADLHEPLEQYFARVNGLAANDPLYLDLVDVQYQIVEAANTYQFYMYDAVLDCLVIYGNSCDPYNDPVVADLILDPGTVELIEALGLVYEVQNLFWYVFYASPAYQITEADAVDEVGAALAPVMPDIEAAREDFRDAVDAIPEVRRAKERLDNLACALRGACCADAPPGWPAYVDGIELNWQLRSTSVTSINGLSTTPVKAGDRAIAVDLATGGNVGFWHADFDTSAYAAVEFYVHGGSAGNQQLQMFLRRAEAAGATALPPVSLNNPAYITGGTISAGTWKRVRIPLSALGGISTDISQIVIQAVGNPPLFHLDEVRLVFQCGANGLAATDTASIGESDGMADGVPPGVAGDLQRMTELAAEINGIQRGDCNADLRVDAGDIAATVAENFDADGTNAVDAARSSFQGQPFGCDANDDDRIDAADVSCVVLAIFGGDCAPH